MSDVKAAVEFVLRQEDATLSGKVTTDAGGRTRFGIAEKFHPELTSTGFFTAMPVAEALATSESIYQSAYWKPICGDQVASQDVADRILSFAINLGPETAVRLLQQAANALGSKLTDDGGMGPETLSAINSLNPTMLLATWRGVLDAYYRSIVAAKPSQAEYLDGWLDRVNA
jgi:lysozyme family protein